MAETPTEKSHRIVLELAEMCETQARGAAQLARSSLMPSLWHSLAAEGYMRAAQLYELEGM